MSNSISVLALVSNIETGEDSIHHLTVLYAINGDVYEAKVNVYSKDALEYKYGQLTLVNGKFKMIGKLLEIDAFKVIQF
jgi:hypothetical protein